MIEEAEEKLREQRAKDEEHLDTFVEFLKEKQVEVHELKDEVNTEASIDYIFKKIEDKLKPRLQFRQTLIERQQAQILSPKEV